MVPAREHAVGLGGRRVRIVALAGACALALIASGPALAAGPWTAASDVGPVGYMPGGLGFTTSGAGMLALAPRGVGRPAMVAATSGDGRLGAPANLTRSDEGFQFENVGMGRQVALFGRDRVVAVGVRRTQSTHEPWVAFGRVGHRLGRRQPLGKAVASLGTMSLAANARGDVALIAVGCNGCPGAELYLFYRPHDGRFGQPVQVARKLFDAGEFSGTSPTVAVNATGDVLVAWGQFTRAGQGTSRPLYARIRHAGRWRGPAQHVGNLLDRGTLTAKLTDDRAVVAWWTQLHDGGGGNGPLGPPRYEVAVAGQRGRFGATKRLDTGAPGLDPTLLGQQFLPVSPNLFATVAPSGSVRLAWTGADEEGPLVRAATLDSGTLTQAQTLGRGALTAMSSDSRGRAAAIWTNETLMARGTELLASTARAGQPYADVPEVVDSGPPIIAGIGDVAFDPRTGRIVAVWETGEPSNPGSVDTWRVRYAIRQPFGR